MEEELLLNREEDTQNAGGEVGMKVTLLHSSVQRRENHKAGVDSVCRAFNTMSRNEMGRIHPGTLPITIKHFLSLLWILILFIRVVACVADEMWKNYKKDLAADVIPRN